MAFINKQDTNGTKATLAKGELGLDDTGNDAGRIYVGDGTSNIPLAKKEEVDALTNTSTAVQGELDATQGGAGLADDGTYVQPSSSAYLNGTTSLADATTMLDTVVKANTDAHTAAEAALNTRTDNVNTATGISNDAYSASSNTVISTATSLFAADELLAQETQRLDSVKYDKAGGVISGDVSVDGVLTTTSTNVVTSATTTPTDDLANGGGLTVKGSTDKTIRWTKATDTWDFSSPIYADVKLKTAQTFTFDGDLTGTGTYDGNTNPTFTVDVNDNSHKHTIANVTGLQSSLDTIQTGTGLAADGTYVAKTNTNYLNGATSVDDATVKLDNEVKVINDKVGVANGIATLDAAGTVPASQLPSYVDDVLEYADLASLPTSGEAGKIYVALDTNKAYRWSGSTYVYITSGAIDSVAGKTGVVTLSTDDVSEGSNLYYTEARVAANPDVVANTAKETNVTTDLSVITTDTTNTVVSSDGTDALLQGATATDAGLLIAADKNKLDGVEAGATADQTPTELLTAIKTVDGTGSGLDADTVDGAELVTINNYAVAMAIALG